MAEPPQNRTRPGGRSSPCALFWAEAKESTTPTTRSWWRSSTISQILPRRKTTWPTVPAKAISRDFTRRVRDESSLTRDSVSNAEHIREMGTSFLLGSRAHLGLLENGSRTRNRALNMYPLRVPTLTKSFRTLVQGGVDSDYI